MEISEVKEELKSKSYIKITIFQIVVLLFGIALGYQFEHQQLTQDCNDYINEEILIEEVRLCYAEAKGINEVPKFDFNFSLDRSKADLPD